VSDAVEPESIDTEPSSDAQIVPTQLRQSVDDTAGDDVRLDESAAADEDSDHSLPADDDGRR